MLKGYEFFSAVFANFIPYEVIKKANYYSCVHHLINMSNIHYIIDILGQFIAPNRKTTE